ncbi:MAG: hypothetical protein ABIO67_01520 [Mycobacteriales bacterium]
MRTTKRISVVAIAVAAATVAASGLAVAYWSTTGVGTAAAAAGSALPLTAGALSVGTGPTATAGGLAPNGSAQAAVIVNNPNSYSVWVNNLVITAAVGNPTSVTGTSTRTGISPACSTTNSGVSLAPGTYAVGALVAAGNNQVVVTSGATKPFAMALDSADNCQGMQFNFATSEVTIN